MVFFSYLKLNKIHGISLIVKISFSINSGISNKGIKIEFRNLKKRKLYCSETNKLNYI